ncbi:hypothetical protein J2S64_002362 [Paeniglutamicibacter sulfureus]|uniref:Uncharacterized protein n=1 Tax=Paeniglutamicibacter sulfureus TaxID=43666 RepID=A0ABU2BK25_9MICC|nr:hypothetical protein [Paeniglutamicibacter sulfureus]
MVSVRGGVRCFVVCHDRAPPCWLRCLRLGVLNSSRVSP